MTNGTTHDRRVVIVGGGQSGGRTAIALREQGYKGVIVLVGEEPHLPYERPPLSKEILTGKLAPEAAQLGDAGFWAELGVTVVTGTQVVEIDHVAARVMLGDGSSFGYDDLVLATGAGPRKLPGDPIPGGGYLRTLDDALMLRQGLREGVRMAVIGAGIIGLELAASARSLGVVVTVIEAADRVMGRVVTPAVSARLQRMHEGKGVIFHFGARIDASERVGDATRLSLADGTFLDTDRQLVAIGVVPNDDLARRAGIATSNGILVDAQGRTSVAGIWAVGDVAAHPMRWFETPVRQETWRHAEAHPRVVAASILEKGEDYNEVPGFWSDQYCRRFQAEGVIGGREVLQDNEDGGFAALYLHDDGRLLGCAVLDNPKIAALARRAIASESRLDLATVSKPNADLRKLLK